MSANYSRLRLVSDKSAADPFSMDQFRLTEWLCKTYAFRAVMETERSDEPLFRRATVLRNFFKVHDKMLRKTFDFLPEEKVTPLVLAFLAHHESDSIRRKVAYHIYTPADVRVILAKSPNPDISEAALSGIRFMLGRDYTNLKYPLIGTPEQKSIAKEALIFKLRN